MNTKTLFLLSLITSLSACGGGDKARFVDACVADGDSEVFCACQGDALSAELDDDVFESLADFAEGMSEASEQAQGQIAMGALANPSLVAALDKTKEVAKRCKQAAALDAAEAEVAVLKSAREQRETLAKSRKCPHIPAVGPLLPGMPVHDVADLRPGMSFDDVEGILECRGNILNFDVAESWVRKSQGLATRQLLRAADGDICSAEARIAGGESCEDGGYNFELLENVGEEFIVAFIGLPQAESAGIIWRRTAFSSDEFPTVSSLRDALFAKYGQPHMAANQEGYYSPGHRRGSVTFSWVYDPSQQPIPDSNGSLRSRCVSGPRPTFARQLSWNASCGTTVRAEIMPAPGNTVLASELNVVVIDQKRFNDAVNQFDIDAKAAVEAQHAGKGATLDL